MDEREMLVDWLDHEQWAIEIMLVWFSKLPPSSVDQPEYHRALNLVGHMVACRENWLDRIVSDGGAQVSWWPEGCELESLNSRFTEALAGWRTLITGASADELAGDFEYTDGNQTWRFNIQCQIMQMLGHGFYHRGQVARMIAELGGTPTDTDYLFWKASQQPDRWGKLS